MIDQILRLKELMNESLPGRDIQYQMSPVRKEARMYYEIPDHARQAAVMALLMPVDHNWQISFIKRPKHPKDKHSGQISFPGGGVEDGDATLEATALRETEEEIGIRKDDIQVLGTLTKLYVYASNNLVHPFVGYLDNKEEFRPQKSEVEQVITVPLSHFMDRSILKKIDLTVRGYTLKEVPYYDLNGEILWGATAMMMSELTELWKRTVY